MNRRSPRAPWRPDNGFYVAYAPPLRMAAVTAETFPRVAKMGLPIFVGLRGMSIPELAGHLRV